MESPACPEVIVISNAGEDSKSFSMTNPYTLIGSSRDCDIIVSIKGVKPIHCQLEVRCGKVILTDFTDKGRKERWLRNKQLFTVGKRKFKIAYPAHKEQKISTRSKCRNYIRLRPEVEIKNKVVAPDYLEIKICGAKGRGIVTKRNINKGEYVCFYSGRRIERQPEVDDKYIFEIRTGRNRIWLDATVEDGSFGRLLNDNHRRPNLTVKVLEVEGELYPAFFAQRDIVKGEELTYNYGGNSSSYWWRKKNSGSCQDLQQTPGDVQLSAGCTQTVGDIQSNSKRHTDVPTQASSDSNTKDRDGCVQQNPDLSDSGTSCHSDTDIDGNSNLPVQTHSEGYIDVPLNLDLCPSQASGDNKRKDKNGYVQQNPDLSDSGTCCYSDINIDENSKVPVQTNSKGYIAVPLNLDLCPSWASSDNKTKDRNSYTQQNPDLSDSRNSCHSDMDIDGNSNITVQTNSEGYIDAPLIPDLCPSQASGDNKRKDRNSYVQQNPYLSDSGISCHSDTNIDENRYVPIQTNSEGYIDVHVPVNLDLCPHMASGDNKTKYRNSYVLIFLTLKILATVIWTLMETATYQFRQTVQDTLMYH